MHAYSIGLSVVVAMAVACGKAFDADVADNELHFMRKLLMMIFLFFHTT